MQTKPDAAVQSGSVVDLQDLEVHYQLRDSSLARLFGRSSGVVRAVDGVTLQLRRGEVLGLVGESGSGKTTLGRALLGLAPATAGSITYHGPTADAQVVSEMSRSQLRALRTELQMIFQDPTAALNPSMDIETAVGHPLKIHGVASGEELRRRVADTLERVGLSPVERFLGKLPGDLSGGQKQRAVIARALILDPEVIVADEPISMLDMSVRAKILQLMLDLKHDLGLTYVYITHDLASAKYFCDRVAIMYLGRIVEIGPTEEIFASPRHPYTKALLAAIPEPDPDRMVPRDLPRGEIPDAAEPPTGCSFHPRCPVARHDCGWESRDLRTVLDQHWLRIPEEDFEAEQRVIGDLAHLDESSTWAEIGDSSPQEVRRVLDRIRSDAPDDPFWTGVADITDTAKGVRIDFAPHVDPGLRVEGGAEVACVLYGDEPSPAAGADQV